MNGAEFDALVADIQANGQREPIILTEGMILDGGNRYRACIEAGIEPQFMQFGGGNLVSYVLSANLHRRHMTAGQQAAIVASAQDWANQAASGSNQHSSKTQGGNSVTPSETDTRSKRAALSGASDRTQQRADKVAKADPELARKVAHGEISLPAAVEQITGKRPGAKPKPEVEPENDGPSEDEIALAQAEHKANEESLRRLLESDDKLAAAYAEIKRLNSELVVVKSSRDGYMNQCAEWQRRCKGLQRKLDGAGRKVA